MSFRDINLRTVGRPARSSPSNNMLYHHSNKRRSKSKSRSPPGSSHHRRLQPQHDTSSHENNTSSYLPTQYVTPSHTPTRSVHKSKKIPVVVGKPVVVVSERRVASTLHYPMDEPAMLEERHNSSALLDGDMLMDRNQEQEYSIYDLSMSPALRPVASNLTSVTCTSSSCESSMMSVENMSSSDRSRSHSSPQRRRRSLPDRRSRTTSPNRPKSAYTRLNEEIINFQKLVSELEQLLVPSAHSPEAQWRARILMRSAQDADRDIWRRLYEYEYENRHDASRVQMACRKLHRDFSRTHKHLSTVLETYDQRQQVQVSFLSASGLVEQSQHNRCPSRSNSASHQQTQEQQQQQVAQEQEDFFDRAMREREAEINNINRSIHKVNEIYTDLAGLVDGQQEKIDQVEQNVHVSRGATDLGAEQIRKVKNNKFRQATQRIGDMFSGMTNPLGMSMGLGDRGPPDQGTGRGSDDPRESCENNNNNENFSWVKTPLEVMGEDIRTFQKGFAEFARDLVDDLNTNVGQKYKNGTICSSMCQESPTCSSDDMDVPCALRQPDTVPMQFASPRAYHP